jgi:hypothetical protein
MPVARAVADIITATAAENDYEDTELTESTLYEAVPVHYVIGSSSARGGLSSFTETTNNAESVTTMRARVRIPARYVVTSGMIVVIDDPQVPTPADPVRWRILRVIPARSPQRSWIATCEKIG